MCPLHILHVLEKNKDHAGEGCVIMQSRPAFCGIGFYHLEPPYSSVWGSTLKLSKAKDRANVIWKETSEVRYYASPPAPHEVSQQGAKSFGELNYCYFYGFFFFLNKGRDAG